MRPGALFLNLSRGFVVDYAALRAHIESGHIAGAAVDVFPVEPKGRGDEFVSELRGLPQRDPHPAHRRLDRGGAAGHRPFRRRQVPRLRRRGRDGDERQPARGIDPAAAAGEHPRLVLMHRNVPGVMATVNGMLADTR